MFGVERSGVLVFDEDKLAEGFHLPVSVVLELLRDGRRGQPIVERRLAQFLAGKGWVSAIVPGGGSRFVDPQGRPWELRAITEALSLAPSHMKGTGRKFDALAFTAHVNALGGVLLVDVLGFPRCAFWEVTREELLEWERAEVLTRGEIRREGLGRILKGLPETGCRPARSVNEEVVLALEDHVAAERKKKGGRS